MDTNTNNENLIPKLKTPTLSYILIAIVIFLIIMMVLIMNDVSLIPSAVNVDKSKQQIINDTLIIIFFSILVIGLCIIFLPSMKDFKKLFEQISNVTYVFIYTIFAILFYTMMSPDIINNYSYIINPAILGLGALAFYKSSKQSYVENFSINYERIKMIILLFCFITLIITFYNINPGGAAQKYFGYSLLLTIIISVFAFIYLIIVMTMGNEQLPTGTTKNLLSNFTSFGVYGSILFVIFLAVITVIISSNKESFFANKEKSAAIIIMLLMICIVWSMALGINLFNDVGANAADSNKFSLLKKSLLAVFGLVISGLIIYWLVYNIESLSGKSSIVSFILNILLVAVILGLIYKTINVRLPSGNSKKNAFFNLILTTLLYIPCILSGGFDWIGKIVTGKYNSTEAGSLIMLVVAILLVIAYFKAPSVVNLVSTQGGNQLVNKPVYTDSQYNLGSYQQLNNGSDNYDYQFAISAWIFLDAMPPNTNPNYTKFTSLLNFGNKPNILYNASENTLMITMQQKDLQKKTDNKLLDFDSEGNRIIYVDKNVLLQKWNNIIINYNGGTFDVFINGELVKSSIEVVPYYTYDNLTIGENNGIKGGICNVIYFRKPLNANNIYYVYHTVKNKTPPTLNDSNETILVKNIGTLSDSANTVVKNSNS